jgi:hypothetical protein
MGHRGSMVRLFVFALPALVFACNNGADGDTSASTGGSGGSSNVGGAAGGTAGTGGSSSSSHVPPTEFMAKFAAAICDNIGGCCASAGLEYDAAKCQSFYIHYYDGFAGDLTSPNAEYDPNAADECIAVVAAVATSCKLNELNFYKVCNDIVRGTLADGAACTSSSECAFPEGGSVECGVGTCEQRPPGKQGDACRFTCGNGGWKPNCWYEDGATGNAACFTALGLACGPSGKCEPLGKVGDACSWGSCSSGTYCDSETQKCAALKEIGESCEADACVSGAYCSSNGQCEAAKADGANCADGIECIRGVCSNGACQPVASSSCSGA